MAVPCACLRDSLLTMVSICIHAPEHAFHLSLHHGRAGHLSGWGQTLSDGQAQLWPSLYGKRY